MHTFKTDRLSEDLPIIVEIVDTHEKLENFLEGLATIEKAYVKFYRHGQP